jgi:molybdopterin/thiamine biosynthesis adenylyltransferase
MNKPIWISIIEQDWALLRRSLLTEDGKENAAALLCGISKSENQIRLLVREIVPVPLGKYETREKLHLRISPSFYNDIINRSLDSGLSPVIIHSHPFHGRASYSPSDDFGESRLLPVLNDLLPMALPSSLLISHTDVFGRRWDQDSFQPLNGLKIIGLKVQILSFDELQKFEADMKYDRQIRAFGAEGQRVIESIKVGIVGLGGIGSLVAEQLARIGIKDLILIDDDEVEASNLSRLLGAQVTDLGRKKVQVIRDHVAAIGVKSVVPIADSALKQSVLLELRDCDLIFGCVDNDRSRALLNRFSHQYLIPTIDLGTRLDAREGSVTGAAGRVTVAGPGLTCLRCSHHLNPERIRAESLPSDERARLYKEGYVMGIDEPAPSVISINTVVAGLGVTAGMNLFVDLTGNHEVFGQLFDAGSGFVFTANPVHEAGCDICDESMGIKALGDTQIVSAY